MKRKQSTKDTKQTTQTINQNTKQTNNTNKQLKQHKQTNKQHKQHKQTTQTNKQTTQTNKQTNKQHKQHKQTNKQTSKQHKQTNNTNKQTNMPFSADSILKHYTPYHGVMMGIPPNHFILRDPYNDVDTHIGPIARADQIVVYSVAFYAATRLALSGLWSVCSNSAKLAWGLAKGKRLRRKQKKTEKRSAEEEARKHRLMERALEEAEDQEILRIKREALAFGRELEEKVEIGEAQETEGEHLPLATVDYGSDGRTDLFPFRSTGSWSEKYWKYLFYEFHFAGDLA